jgi:hypothetical protein
MSRMNDYHRRLEKLFADLLSTEAQLPSDGRYWINHYIDHGEYELALDNAIASFQKDARYTEWFSATPAMGGSGRCRSSRGES